MRFRSFQARLLSFFVGLLVVVQAGGFLITNAANSDYARRQVIDSLRVTAGIFERLLADRNASMLEAGRLLSGDFAFKTAYATREPGTILSMLQNHRSRIGADVMLLLGLDDRVLADTLHPGRSGVAFDQPGLIDLAYADARGEAAALVLVDGVPYQMAVLPLLIPHHDGWILIGFRVDDGFARALQGLAASEVSVLGPGAGGPRLLASSLETERRRELAAAATVLPEEASAPRVMALGGEEYLSLSVPLPGIAGQGLSALLQRSLDRALAPFRRLQWVLLGLFLLGVLLSLVGGAAIAGTVSRPVWQLARGAARVAEGDYSQRVELHQRDEVGELARSFNHMVAGLAERDRVRNLLGKVVSPAIAEELLSKEIELGGEERQATVLFADIRNFTTLSETRAPREILDLLNTLLTRFSDVIEAHGGVIDKYIGDAVMALFGAPLAHEDDPARAVAAALALSGAVDELNAAGVLGPQPVGVGMGINTGLVVAGNMGSRQRLNYTVLGDGVNLASRLEGLTRVYGVRVVVSDATRRAAPGFAYRELDWVRVKGRGQPERVFEPVAPLEALSPRRRTDLETHARALAAYRGRDWGTAEALLADLPDDVVRRLYLERIAAFRAESPPADWDGSVRFDHK